MVVAAIPSPSQGVLHLGSVPLRAYAFMIIVGVVVAVWLTGRRLRARGTDPAFATDAAVLGVVLGIIGARLYHVFTSPDAYFGKNGHVLHVLYVWNGGLGIWGAIAGGALGVWLACRRARVSFLLFADAAAPALLFAQAIGRLGNYFNQELFGRPTTLPWALEIDFAHRPAGYTQYETFHPTFLYELIWNVLAAVTLLVIDHRRRLGRGRLFAMYVMLYTIGRGLVEALRIDDAHHFLGLRLNDWTSFVVYAFGLVLFLLLRKPADEDKPFVPAVADGEAGGGEAGGGEATDTDAKDSAATTAEAAKADAPETTAEGAKDDAAGGVTAGPPDATAEAGKPADAEKTADDAKATGEKPDADATKTDAANAKGVGAGSPAVPVGAVAASAPGAGDAAAVATGGDKPAGDA